MFADFSEREKHDREVKQQPDILHSSSVLCTTYSRLHTVPLQSDDRRRNKMQQAKGRVFWGEGEWCAGLLLPTE